MTELLATSLNKLQFMVPFCNYVKLRMSSLLFSNLMMKILLNSIEYALGYLSMFFNSSNC
jgi:hypothetical protein